jgi:hypothetical protein
MKREFTIILFRLHASSSSSTQENVQIFKKKKHGRFKRFLSAVNAVLHTPQELYTHHYVCLDVLP